MTRLEKLLPKSMQLLATLIRQFASSWSTPNSEPAVPSSFSKQVSQDSSGFDVGVVMWTVEVVFSLVEAAHLDLDSTGGTEWLPFPLPASIQDFRRQQLPA